MYDVYVTLLYQLKPEYGGKVNDVQEMTINLNITTYQNKIRFNTIEMTPQERTLGFDLMNPEDMMNLKKAKEIILRVVRKRICNAYKNHIILF